MNSVKVGQSLITPLTLFLSTCGNSEMDMHKSKAQGGKGSEVTKSSFQLCESGGG